MVKGNRISKSRGVTLVELMITVAIISVIALMLPNLVLSFVRLTQLNTARLETQRNARNVLSQINRSLRQAKSSSVVISQESGQPYYSSITFSTVDNRTLKYYQTGQTLNFVSNGSTTTLANELRYIAFSYPQTDDQGILSISLTFQKDTYQGGTKAIQMDIENVRVMD